MQAICLDKGIENDRKCDSSHKYTHCPVQCPGCSRAGHLKLPRGKEGAKEILAAKLRRAVQRSAQTLGSFLTLLPTVVDTVQLCAAFSEIFAHG